MLKKYLFEHKYQYRFNKTAIYINEINREIKTEFSYKQVPAKMVLLIYHSWDNEDLNLLDKDIIIIKVPELVGYNFLEPTTKCKQGYDLCLPNDNHPNKKAWEIIVPLLTKKLNL